MKYTDREELKYYNNLKEFGSIYKYKYLELLYTNNMNIEHLISLNLYMRNEDFKNAYEDEYSFIENNFDKVSSFPVNGYSEKSLENNHLVFTQCGYSYIDIQRYIFKQLTITKKIFKDDPYNTKTENEYSLNENNYERKLIQFNTTQKQNLLPEYNADFNDNSFMNLENEHTFKKQFDLYEYNYSVPINKVYQKKNSLNVNILVSDNINIQKEQLEKIAKLIKDSKEKSEVQHLVKLKRDKLIMYFYLYDMRTLGIPNLFIKEFLEKSRKYPSESDTKRMFENDKDKILEICTNIQKLIVTNERNNYISHEDIKDLFKFLDNILKEYQLLSTYTYFFNNFLDKNHLQILSTVHNSINDIKKYRQQIFSIIEKAQSEIAEYQIANNPSETEFFTNNYRSNPIHYESCDFSIAKTFIFQDNLTSLVSRIKLININSLMKKIYFDLSKTKTSTLNTYYNNIKSLIDNL